jgi:hypothetical protein
MRDGSRRFRSVSALLLAALLAGCAASPQKTAPPAGAAAKKAPQGKGELPREIGVTLRLEEGLSWKSRFVSTGEVRRVHRPAAGQESQKARSIGLELVATQTVRSVKGPVARIEVKEHSARILQDGKFVEAPFRRLSPPETVFFSVHMDTGKADFAELEKAYADWFATVKESPAGDVLGRTFRIDGYVSQLKDLYGKPFTRLAGKKLTKEYRTVEEKEFLLPFVGPGADLGPMPVESSMAYEGFEVRGGGHFLNVAGKYAGESKVTPEQLSGRLEEFAAKAPGSYESKSTASGRFRASVDVLSGREERTESQIAYTAEASFGGASFREEIAAKFQLEPAE